MSLALLVATHSARCEDVMTKRKADTEVATGEIPIAVLESLVDRAGRRNFEVQHKSGLVFVKGQWPLRDQRCG